jgi:hypothetical protein
MVVKKKKGGAKKKKSSSAGSALTEADTFVYEIPLVRVPPPNTMLSDFYISLHEPEWERASLPPHSGVLSIHIQPTRFTQGVIANESLRMSLHPSCVGEVHNPTT